MKARSKAISLIAAICVLALALVSLVACNKDIIGGKKDLYVAGFRGANDIVLTLKTARSTISDEEHDVKFFRSSQTELSELAKEIAADDSLSVRMPGDDCFIIEKMGHGFANGEWRAYAEMLFVKRYSPEKGSDYAKNKLNYFVSGCVCEIDGDNDYPTAFLAPLYLMRLSSPTQRLEEGKGVKFDGAMQDAEEFYLRCGCDVEAEGNALIVTDVLGSQREEERNIATKYRVTLSGGELSFELLEVDEYAPDAE